MRSWRMSLIPLTLNLFVVICVYTYANESVNTTQRQREIYLLFGHLVSGYCSYKVARRIKNESFKNIEGESPKQEMTNSSQVESGGSPASLIDKISVDLERVQEMKDSGLITDEEYSAMRSKILGI
jgi:hypothetical protein